MSWAESSVAGCDHRVWTENDKHKVWGEPVKVRNAEGLEPSPSCERLPIRGGNWNNTANAGVFALNLNNPRSNVNTNIGFRCDFD